MPEPQVSTIAEPVDFRAIAGKAIWRISATAIWVWIIGHFTSPGSFPGRIASLRGTAFVALIGMFLLIDLAIRRDRKSGCLSACLYPFYVLTWPLWLATLVTTNFFTLLSGTLRRSQKFLGSLLPYAVTSVTCVAATLAPYPYWRALVLIFGSLSLLLVLISLAAWVFEPLSWVSAALSWNVRFNIRNAGRTPLPTLDELLGNAPKARENLKIAATAIASAHTNLQKTPAGYEQIFRDALIAAAFARKFLMSLVHVGLLFSLAHFAVNYQPGAAESVSYSGITNAPFGSTWFEYLYFALMTLITGDVGVEPVATSARVLVLLNAYSGVAFLVLLVTIFSMITRERVRNAVGRALADTNAAITTLERRALEVAFLAVYGRALEPGVESELRKISVSTLPSEKASAYRGVLVIQAIVTALESANRVDDLAFVLGKRARMSVQDFTNVSDALSAANATSLDEVVAVLRAMPADLQPAATREAP